MYTGTTTSIARRVAYYNTGSKCDQERRVNWSRGDCAHMHCDVDLLVRSRRMWAASYRLTRLIMNEDSHVPRGPDTGRERVLTQRRGNGDDGAGGGCARARASMLLRPLHLVWWLGWVSLGGGTVIVVM